VAASPTASARPARHATMHSVSEPMSDAPALALPEALSHSGGELVADARARVELATQSQPVAVESATPAVAAAAPAQAMTGAAERPEGRAATVPAAKGAVQSLAADGATQSLAARVHAQSPPRSQPTRRFRAATVTTRAMPVLVIDDEHPEEAERSQEERVERSEGSWRSFLPPALLDSDDGSHRGTLTLAVIILVIVATLTMSYLLRRPNVSGDGVTWQAPARGELSNPRAHA
jgi:hypothetical protein